MGQVVTPTVRNLLVACIGVYLLQMVMGERLVDLFGLWPPNSFTPHFQPWQLVSYAFLHDPGSFTHILFNMFALYMFGPEIERLLGARRFFTYYIVCVIGAASPSWRCCASWATPRCPPWEPRVASSGCCLPLASPSRVGA